MAFHVGQKVCCITDDEWKQISGFSTLIALPKKGDILTISEIDYEMDCHWLGFIEYGPRPLFLAELFRPLVERKTDISIFTRILKDADNRVGVDA